MKQERVDVVPPDDGHFGTVLAAARHDAGWAFERLFRTFAPRVSGYLRVQGAVEPDELTNDVFMSAFRSLGRFTGGCGQPACCRPGEDSGMTSDSIVRVVVVDRDVVRAGFSALLDTQPDFTVVGTAADGLEAARPAGPGRC